MKRSSNLKTLSTSARQLRRLIHLQTAIVVVLATAAIASAVVCLGPGSVTQGGQFVTWAILGAIVLGCLACDRLAGQQVAALATGAATLHLAASDRAANLARANADLSRQDRERAELFATMSHELRTPLNAILGYSRALLDGLDGELNAEQRADVLHIHDGGQGLLAIVNGALEMARLDAGRVQLRREPVDGVLLADEVMSFLTPLADERGLELVNRVPSDLPELMGDEGRLRQILLNLVGNAIKFTDRGSVTMSATILDGVARLSVTDTGIGVPAEARDVIFEPFRQADQAATRRHGGTGLGLPIAKRLVELMGGRISLDSEPGHGSAFHVTIPLAPRAASPSVVNDEDGAPQRVLLVGDGVDLEQVQARLSRRGLDAVSASADRWPAVLHATTPDLVVFDLLLPGAGAWHALATLKAMPPDRGRPALVAVTADGQMLLLALGPSDYLLTPRDNAVLAARTAALVNERMGLSGITGLVLVVDGEPATRLQRVTMLQAAGLAVREAANHDAAVSAVLTEAPAAVVLDLLLPDGTSLDVLHALRSRPRTCAVPIVLTSPLSLSPLQQRSLYLAALRLAREHGTGLEQAAIALAGHLTGEMAAVAVVEGAR